LRGLARFTVFTACIALGVMAIAGVDRSRRELQRGLASERPHLLGRRRGVRPIPSVKQSPMKSLSPFARDRECVRTLRAMAPRAGDAPASLW